MDLRKLKKLIDLVEESSITELEINDAEERVRIVKHGGGSRAPCLRPVAGPPLPVVAAAGAAALPAPAEEPEVPEGDAVKAPMVGTFYRASSPGAEPFVEVGSSREDRRHAVHHRSDEVAQRDRSRAGGYDQGDSDREWPTGRIW
jgi:acetyl-CoA carboxylase biotin carboxyl carrier protein